MGVGQEDFCERCGAEIEEEDVLKEVCGTCRRELTIEWMKKAGKLKNSLASPNPGHVAEKVDTLDD